MAGIRKTGTIRTTRVAQTAQMLLNTRMTAQMRRLTRMGTASTREARPKQCWPITPTEALFIKSFYHRCQRAYISCLVTNTISTLLLFVLRSPRLLFVSMMGAFLLLPKSH